MKYVFDFNDLKNILSHHMGVSKENYDFRIIKTRSSESVIIEMDTEFKEAKQNERERNLANGFIQTDISDFLDKPKDETEILDFPDEV